MKKSMPRTDKQAQKRKTKEPSVPQKVDQASSSSHQVKKMRLEKQHSADGKKSENKKEEKEDVKKEDYKNDVWNDR